MKAQDCCQESASIAPPPSTLFTKAGFPGQIRCSAAWLVLSANALHSEAESVGGILHLPGVYMGVWGSELWS